MTVKPSPVQLTVPTAAVSTAITVSQPAQRQAVQTLQIPAAALQAAGGIPQIVLVNPAQLQALQPQLLVGNQVRKMEKKERIILYCPHIHPKNAYDAGGIHPNVYIEAVPANDSNLGRQRANTLL
jgi:rhodanese-related sulfurtransferase